MTISLAPHVTLTKTEHGLVLLNERTGQYWQMNSTGATVLTWLLDGQTLESAIAHLRQRHPNAADRAETDVHNLILALHIAKVITA
jgi:coenzyme PQQ synthesis protein D (PqqD)